MSKRGLSAYPYGYNQTLIMVKAGLPKRNYGPGTGVIPDPCAAGAGPTLGIGFRWSADQERWREHDSRPLRHGIAHNKNRPPVVQAGGHIGVRSYGGFKPGVEIGAGLKTVRSVEAFTGPAADRSAESDADGAAP
jgi:hypothetical protein